MWSQTVRVSRSNSLVVKKRIRQVVTADLGRALNIIAVRAAVGKPDPDCQRTKEHKVIRKSLVESKLVLASQLSSGSSSQMPDVKAVNSVRSTPDTCGDLDPRYDLRY